MSEQAYRIICVTPTLIQLEVTNIDEFVSNEKNQFKIGSYLKITDNNNISVIAIVHSYKIKDFVEKSEYSEPGINRSFIVDTQPIGFLDQQSKFKRGGQKITIPPTTVDIADQKILELFYNQEEKISKLILGSMTINENIRVPIDGDKFFSKHIAVVGSTGSGKSCAVAKILQEGIQAKNENRCSGVLNNSHIILFDIHGEYPAAFPKANILNVDNLVLPYWLMNSEELEEMFIESNEQNSHNQISQFRHAVIENKKKHNSELKKITYDTPVYFSLTEVCNYISNLNNEVIGKQPGEGFPKLADSHGQNSSGSELIKSREERYFKERLNFVVNSTANNIKASNGPFNGEFDRFIRRLETKIEDERLDFFLKPKKTDGQIYQTSDIEFILRNLIGYTEVDNYELCLMPDQVENDTNIETGKIYIKKLDDLTLEYTVRVNKETIHRNFISVDDLKLEKFDEAFLIQCQSLLPQILEITDKCHACKKNSNITIIDLAGIPFEETSIVVSLISRILFEFSFFFKRNQLKHELESTNVPILVVYEEAHKYAPNNGLSKFRSAKIAIERIAKEGRKYGISLMIVSQRPSEISETIFSQCNNFVAMRLTNPSDQNYVKKLLPDTINDLTDNLPILEKQEAIIIGDSITIPTLIKIDSIENKPKSIDIDVLTEWKKEWYNFKFNPIIDDIQKKKRVPVNA